MTATVATIEAGRAPRLPSSPASSDTMLEAAVAIARTMPANCAPSPCAAAMRPRKAHPPVTPEYMANTANSPIANGPLTAAGPRARVPGRPAGRGARRAGNRSSTRPASALTSTTRPKFIHSALAGVVSAGAR